MNGFDRACLYARRSWWVAVVLVLSLSAVTAGAAWPGAVLTPVVVPPALVLAAGALAAALCLRVLVRRAADRRGAVDLQELVRAEQVIRHAEEGILTISARGLILSLNPAAEKLFGYPAAEVVGQPITKLMAEPQSQDRSNLLRESLPAGSILGLAAGAREVIGLRKNGETFPLELTGSGMLIGEHAVSVAFVRDVSKRKQAQRYLIGHYAATCVLAEAGSLAEALPHILQAVCEPLQWEAGVYWRVDRDTGRTVAAEVYRSSAGSQPSWPDVGSLACRSGQALPGRVWASGKPEWVEDLLTSPDEACLAAACGAPVRGAFGVPVAIGPDVCGVLTFFSDRCQKRDNQLLDIMADLGKQLGHFVARKQQEEALRETSQTLQSLIRAAPVAIHIVDLEGKVRLWNPAAERIFGWSEAEALGRPIPPFVSDRPGEEGVATPLEPASLAGHGLPVRCLNKGGGRIDVSMSTAPLRDGTGKVFGVMGIGMDLTEQRSLEEQLRQAQKMEAVGQLAGGIAHDFNNLLTIITGYCEVLLADLPPDAAAYGYVREIENAGERATRLTRQLLAFSRKQIIQPCMLDLNGAVANVHKMLTRLIGEHIRLFTALTPDLGLVYADPGQVEQVLINLALNARDAMPAGGKLTVETSGVWVGEGQCPPGGELSPGRYARLAVRDTGCGMDARTLARVFEPFFTTKELGKGTGLGLATVYGIVKQSGGHVRAISEVGKGATFEVYLPIVAAAGTAAGEDAAANRPPTPGGHETVLLAEDEEAVRALARRVLQGAGYTVLEAADGQEAIKVAVRSGGAVDLLLTDVVMPHVGGRVLAEAVTSRFPNVSVLYISGYTDDAVLQNGVLSSESAFLQKPFRPDELLHKIREVLDKNRPPVSAAALGYGPLTGHPELKCG